MKTLYAYELDYGRQGSVEGLFIAEDSAVAAALGKRIYFGEILGKHSEVYADLALSQLDVKSTDQDFIQKLEDLFGEGTISGYNPLDNVSDWQE